MPGPFAPPDLSLPRRNITALSYSLTTCRWCRWCPSVTFWSSSPWHRRTRREAAEPSTGGQKPGQEGWHSSQDPLGRLGVKDEQKTVGFNSSVPERPNVRIFRIFLMPVISSLSCLWLAWTRKVTIVGPSLLNTSHIINICEGLGTGTAVLSTSTFCKLQVKHWKNISCAIIKFS